jgi:phospholipid/cholesterol/gamma-HCH transport system ATP-binding protein
LTVAENVAFPMMEGRAGRVKKKRVHELVRHCLELVGLTGFEEKRPAELSGGEKKRVALARAIALDPAPKVILYDEPTTGLDPPRADVINKLIRHLQRAVKVTGVVVTHDMKSATEVGDRILMLWRGRFIADGPPESIRGAKEDHVRRFVEGRAEPEDVRILSA